jgi:tetratricopeptide (TPR) repeat protein
MERLVAWVRRFVQELRRRRVIRVAVVYAGTAFVILQLGGILVEPFNLPGWTLRLVTFLLLLGFPLAVGLAWVFDVTEEGLVRTGSLDERGGKKLGPQGKPFTSDVVIIGLLALVAGLLLYPRLFSSGPGTSPATQAGAGEIAERSVAVLPFEVSGSGAEDWRDGMVTALSLNLDGAAGLRAIADRTVFAAWEKAGKASEGASTQDALAVARKVGTRYAVVGSALQLGEDLRFAAEVWEVASEKRLGQVEVEGSPEKVTTLTDRLTRKVLGLLLDRSKEALPSVDLASITTSSFSALKLYLAGERHFRSGEYEAAIEDYEAALEKDSSFALASARLARSYGWTDQYKVARQQSERAYKLSGRLPPRDRAVVQGTVLRYRGQALAAVDTLQQAADRYPDDPGVWYALGEVLVHGYVPPGWPRAEEAFQQAVELDPGAAHHHQHLVDLGFALHRDSALVARRIAAHPGGPLKKIHQLAKDLIFGSPERRKRTLARLDTVTIAEPRHLAEWAFLHPADAAFSNRVLAKLRSRSDIDDDFMMWLTGFNDQRQGHLQAIRKRLEEAPSGAGRCPRALWLSLGIWPAESAGEFQWQSDGPPPDTLAQRELGHYYCTGLGLLAQGQTAEAGELLRHLRGASAVEGLRNELLESAVGELKAYRAWKNGDLDRASKLWPDTEFAANWPIVAVPRAIWYGDLSRDRGNLTDAEGWYLAAWRQPVAHERLGQLYEQMGKPEKAAAAYERFIAAWEDADPELQPRVEKARQRLDALQNETAAE